MESLGAYRLSLDEDWLRLESGDSGNRSRGGREVGACKIFFLLTLREGAPGFECRYKG